MTGKVVYCGKRNGLYTPYDVYIGSDYTVPYGGPTYKDEGWGNPWHKPLKAGYITRAEAVEQFLFYMLAPEQAHLRARLGELKGKTLACWCAGKPGIPKVLTAEDPHYCHGHALLQLVELLTKPFTYATTYEDIYGSIYDGPPMVPTFSIVPLLVKEGEEWATTYISVGPPEFYWSSEVAVLIKGEGWDKRRYVLVPAMGPATPPEAPRVVPIRRLRDLTPERLKSILDKEMPGWDVPTPALLAPKGALYAKRHPILWKGRLVYDRYERKHRVPRFYRTQQPVSYISYKDLPRLVEADEARLEREYSTEHEKFTRALRERPHLVQCYGVGDGHASYIHTHRTAERAFKCHSGFLWRVRGADPFVTPDRTYLKPVADTLRRKLEVRRLSPEKSYMRPFATPLREMLASMKFAEEEDLQPHKAFKTEKDRIVQAMRDLCGIDVWDSKPFVDYAYSSISAQKAATTLKRKRGDYGPIKVANYYENVLRSAYDYTRAVHPGRGVTVGELAKVLVRERKYRVNTKPSGVRPPTEVTIGNVEGASIAALKGSWRPAGALEPSTLEFIFQGEELPLRFLARTVELGVQSKKTCRKTFGLLARISRTMDYLTWPDLYRSVRAEVSPPKSKRTHSKHPKLLTGDMLGRSGEGSDTPVYALPETIPNTKGDYFADGAPKLSGRPGILYTRPTRLRPRKVYVKDEESRGRVIRPADPASVVVAYTVYEDAQIPEQIHSYSVPSVIQARVREAARSARDYPLTMPYIDTAEVPERVKPVATMANPARWRQKEAGIVRARPGAALPTSWKRPISSR
jgi:hypothetical protein